MTVNSETDLLIGPQALIAYSRLSYTMWHALAEFIDNSTQSRKNYENIIDDILRDEGTPLVVKINYNRLERKITIRDNSIGMSHDDLVAALKVAQPTADSRGRSKYGMGMKTAACWIGQKWKVTTSEWGSNEEWEANVDVEAIANRNAKVPLSMRPATTDSHFTEIEITQLNRNIQKRTEENIRLFLGSMYRNDLISGNLKLLYNGDEINAPDEASFDTDPQGSPMKTELPDDFVVGGKQITGWFGVLRKGAGGRKYGGFSLFQNGRQIQGFPNAWKPTAIFSGVDEEGANNLVAQRLVGVLNMDGFDVSHTKDTVLYKGDEEAELEKKLTEITADYRNYAKKRRGDKTQQWTREKVRDLVQNMGQEFASPEMGDALNNTILPPLDAIVASNQRQASALAPDDYVAQFVVGNQLSVRIALQERSENDQYVTIVAAAEPNSINIIINRLHPYYESLETSEAVDECIRQFIHDAISEYRVHRQQANINPDSVRRAKDALLRVQELRIDNAAARLEREDLNTSVSG
ncbi:MULTISPECIES: ATP-binding protein [unclassified Methylobacterium]|uniref:ATP-binding protein n=1 Tax=unclassified Methylobacterium TaxID=2615210 RepID=UPI0008EA93FF|nr:MULTISPECIES: ATP-binding protein [unclassified Methylobacterium]RTL21769.1 MAG: ATP-binding protein [Burkholderiales bacterium]SFV15537.1 Histidine kinase-, DNA gyrase B-, and HSP90-like ATPase [Methylobacterium sp. UNCCL125]